MEMSSFLPKRKFAFDNFRIFISYDIESFLIVQNVHKMFRLQTSCRRTDRFSDLYYLGSAVITVNISIHYFCVLFNSYEYVIKKIAK